MHIFVKLKEVLINLMIGKLIREGKTHIGAGEMIDHFRRKETGEKSLAQDGRIEPSGPLYREYAWY